MWVSVAVLGAVVVAGAEVAVQSEAEVGHAYEDRSPEVVMAFGCASVAVAASDATDGHLVAGAHGAAADHEVAVGDVAAPDIASVVVAVSGAADM